MLFIFLQIVIAEKEVYRLKKVILSVLLVGSLVGLLFFQSAEANADIERIESELEQLKQQKAESQQRMNEAEQKIANIQEQLITERQNIQELMDQIEETATVMKELQSDIEQQEAALDQKQMELNDAIDRIEARDQLLQSRLRLIYMNGSVSYLEVLLESTSFSDFLERFQALRSLANQDKEMLEANKRDKQLIEEQKQEIELLIASLSSKYDEMELLQHSLLQKQKQKEVMIASLEQEQAHLEHITEEQEQILIETAKREAALIAEKQRIETVYQGGTLAYPLPKTYPITSEFGYRIDPITGEKGAYHSGMDFGAPNGTDILAAEGGTVITAGWYGGFGNTVIIDHGGGLWTLYGHIRPGGIKVEKGDKVERGQKIAEVGTTGRSTGYHLHFTVYKNEQPVNPRDYLNLSN